MNKNIIIALKKYLFRSFKVAQVPDIVWTTTVKNIKNQGYPWENKIASIGYTKLPYGFKTFDFYDNGVAISAKTINTLSPSYTKKENHVKYIINKYIKDISKFGGYSKSGITVTPEDIYTKELLIGVPKRINGNIAKAINIRASNHKIKVIFFRIY